MAITVSLCSVRQGGSEYEKNVMAYLQRAARSVGAEARSFRSEEALLDHAGQTAKQGSALLWLADSRGKLWSSAQFAAEIARARDGGIRQLVLGVGPASGWSPEALRHAAMLISLGPMTLPHELARLVLAEQVYRAATILAGHPYHLGH